MTTKRTDDRAKRLGDAVRWVIAAWPTLAARVDVEAMTLVWGMALVDLDPDEVKLAVVELSKSEHSFPSIAKIRARVVAMHIGEQRPGGDAWGDVLRLRSPRPLSAFDALDPVVLRCLDRLGLVRRQTVVSGGRDVVRWYVSLSDNETADRARFIELYGELSGQMRKAVQVSPGATMRSLPRAETTQALGGIVRGLLTTTRTEEDDDGDSE